MPDGVSGLQDTPASPATRHWGRFVLRLRVGREHAASLPAPFRSPVRTDSEDEVVAQAPAVEIRLVFRRFWPYTKSFRALLVLTLLVVAIVPAADTALIWMYKLLIDRVVVPRDSGPFVPLVAAYLGLTLLSGGVLSLDRYLTTWVGERFVLGLRRDFFRHVQSLSLDFLDRRRLGDIVSRLTNDISTIETFVVSGLGDALAYGLRIVFFAGALFYLSWKLALAALLIGPVFLLVTRLFTGPIRDASREKRRRLGSISAVAEESLSNALLVQAYGREDFEVERVHRESLGAFAAELRSARVKRLYAPLIGSLEAAGLILVLGLGTWELSRGRITIGGLLVFVTYLSQLYSPIRRMGRLGNTVSAASAAAERVIEYLDQRPSIVERPHALSVSRAGGAVLFENVSFGYPGTKQRALAGVTFAVEPGETLALVGPSGAGKTTVAKLLLRFYDPQAGRVLLDGHDVRDLSLRSLRANVTVLLQETLVFSGTVRDNIAYGRADATEHQIEAAARAADAEEFILALPEGYETVVGQKGRLLSGGQRQRLAIARAMIRDAPVLLLDEPTTGLDADSAERILEPLRRLMRDRATIVISHNLLTVRDATTILVLEKGKITGRGTHADLLGRDETYARLYRRHRPEEVQSA